MKVLHMWVIVFVRELFLENKSYAVVDVQVPWFVVLVLVVAW